MRQNPNQNPRQSGEQHRQQQQPPQGQPPQGQPPQGQQQQPPQGQPPQGQQQQPPQGRPPQQGRSQGQPSPPQMGSQQGGRPPQQPPQGRQMGQQSPGMQQGMTSQQGQPSQQGMQPGMGAQQPPQMGGQPSHLQSVSLQDIMQEDVVTADPDTPIPTITSQMKQEDVGAVVITEDDEPQGIVTDRKVAVSLEEMPDISERTGEEVMSESVVSGEESMSVYEALQQLSDENVRRLPIVDDEGKLVGIVTLDDIMVLLGEELKDSTEIIKSQSPRL